MNGVRHRSSEHREQQSEQDSEDRDNVRDTRPRSCPDYQIEIEKEMVLTVKMVGDSL